MYLVIGASGFLGSYVIKNILEKTNDSIIACARDVSRVSGDGRTEWVSADISSEEDVTELAGFVQDRCDNDLRVIFLAAYHNPDLVARDPAFAWNINVTALSRCINLLRFAKRIFYISTDSVYGNSVNGHSFRENEELSPVNEYGRQKCAAEYVVRYAGFNVVRYPFLIGKSLSAGREHFYDRICRDLKSGKPVEMFSDSYRSSLDFDTAAGLLVGLCGHDGDIPQVLNVCGDKALSKYDIGLMIADKLGVSRELVVPVKMESSNIFAASRALSTVMDNSLVKSLLGKDEINLVI